MALAGLIVESGFDLFLRVFLLANPGLSLSHTFSGRFSLGLGFLKRSVKAAQLGLCSCDLLICLAQLIVEPVSVLYSSAKRGVDCRNGLRTLSCSST